MSPSNGEARDAGRETTDRYGALDISITLGARGSGLGTEESYFMAWALGSSHENTKSVSEGNKVVSKPISGPTPNASNRPQKSQPRAPGSVLVMWLSVASRDIWE